LGAPHQAFLEAFEGACRGVATVGRHGGLERQS
jgi:hypothetical protein